MNSQSMQIVVTGLAGTYPFGGVFWDYIQYVLGLHRMGHRVLYLEDTGKWCYSPVEQTFVERGDANAAYLAKHLSRLEPELADAWFYRDATGQIFGKSWDEAVRFCREADLFLHISASCWMREEYFTPDVVAFIDSDPMYTQGSVRAYADGTGDEADVERIDMLRRHDVHFTFGENCGASDCRMPTELFDWRPTRQPVVVDCFEAAARPASERRRALTTIASWEPNEDGPTIDGVKYCGKSVEFQRFMDLPQRSELPLELALSGRFPQETLLDAGWAVRPAYDVSNDPWVYRDYLATSLGEWSVAKQAYAASRSGWFSCRSACYLAAGVPVIVQDTGFMPGITATGGVQRFSTVDEAAEAITRLAASPASLSDAAIETARTEFEASRVLNDLLEAAFASPEGRAIEGATVQ